MAAHYVDEELFPDVALDDSDYEADEVTQQVQSDACWKLYADHFPHEQLTDLQDRVDEGEHNNVDVARLAELTRYMDVCCDALSNNNWAEFREAYWNAHNAVNSWNQRNQENQENQENQGNQGNQENEEDEEFLVSPAANPAS